MTDPIYEERQRDQALVKKHWKWIVGAVIIAGLVGWALTD